MEEISVRKRCDEIGRALQGEGLEEGDRRSYAKDVSIEPRAQHEKHAAEMRGIDQGTR